MSAEAFMWADEVTWGTWVAPTKAIPVRSASVNPETTFMEAGVTGGGKGRRPGAAGEISVNGPMETLLYPVDLGFIVRTLFKTRAKTAAGAGWLNKLLPNDAVDNGSLSLQKRYTSARAESIKGAKINTFTLSARSREYATATFDFAAKDAAASGGTFSDGVAAPAVIDPVPYSVGLPDGLKFYQGELLLGGSYTLVAGQLVYTGGTARCEIDNVELTANFNISTDAYGLCLDDRTVQALDEGQREVNLRFDPNFATVGFEFYNAWRNGTPAAVQLHFLGPEFEAGQKYDLKFSLPYVVYQNAANPEINAEYGLKRSTVEGGCYIDPTLGVDWGLAWQTTDDLTV